MNAREETGPSAGDVLLDEGLGLHYVQAMVCVCVCVCVCVLALGWIKSFP